MFRKWFPVLDIETDTMIRKSYKGGFTYLNPRYANLEIKGVVFDVNSLYPSVMYYNPLPIGYPISYEGQYEFDEYYPLYIQHIRVGFILKQGYLPTIQVKNNFLFVSTEYLESSKGEIIDLYLTNVDLELFLKHYDIQYIEYVSGVKFQSCINIFKEYIDKWYAVKNTEKGAKKEVAKLMLNSLYGKFATNPARLKKIPYLDEDEIVKFYESDVEYCEPIYTPIGCFITAWARFKTISSAQKVYDRFIYADTDSLHLEGFDIPTEIDIDQKRLGAWKHESTFIRGKFLRAKTYMETDEDGKTLIKCAGMPKDCKALVTYDNFHIGEKFAGKLRPVKYKGGIILEDVDFTIKA
jgi:hypothetical protein